MPRGKGLPGGACHGARDFTRGGIAPGQGFLPGGHCPPVATSLRTTCQSCNVKGSTILSSLVRSEANCLIANLVKNYNSSITLKGLESGN